MDNKQKKSRRRKPRTETLAVQKEKLAHLVPEDLIPEALEQSPLVKGVPKIFLTKTEESFEFVIKDDEETTPEFVETHFEFVDKSRLEDFPELKIKKGKISRPLIYGSYSQLTPDQLFGGILEVHPKLRGKGIGVLFDNNLAELSKKLGYKFLTGYHNDSATARFFLNRGNFLLEEVKDQYQSEFKKMKEIEEDETVFYTIKILNPKDISRLIKPERIGTTVEDKLEYKEKYLKLRELFLNLRNAIEAVEKQEEHPGDRATIIEIMEDLNESLPKKDQTTAFPESEDDEDFLFEVKRSYNHLLKKFSVLLRELTLKKIIDNLVI